MRMTEAKRAALEAAGFRVGDAADFLEMSESERAELEERLREYKRGRSRRVSGARASARVGTDSVSGAKSSLPKR